MSRVGVRWYRVWSALTSLLWLLMFCTIFFAEASLTTNVTVIAVFAVITFGPWAVGWVRGRLAPPNRADNEVYTNLTDAPALITSGRYAKPPWLSEWMDRTSDYLLARSQSKNLNPARTIAAAYRTAALRAEKSGDFSHAVLRQALQEWSVPGAYDDPDSVRVRPAYDAWDLQMSPHTFRREMRRLYAEGKWVPKAPRLPWQPWSF